MASSSTLQANSVQKGHLFMRCSIFLGYLLAACVSHAPSTTAMVVTPGFKWADYPQVLRDPSVVSERFEKEIPDPYRWLEDPKVQGVADFIEAQNQVTDKYFNQSDFRPKFAEKLSKMFEYERFTAPSKRGKYYYYWYNSGHMDHSIIKRQLTVEGSNEVIFDPNILSHNGSLQVTPRISFSTNATYFAYSLQTEHEDSMTIHVQNVAGQMDLPDVIIADTFSNVVWTNDALGFFYTAYSSSNDDNALDLDAMDLDDKPKRSKRVHRVYYHKLGTPQKQDTLVWEDNDHPHYHGTVTQSFDGMYLILEVSKSTLPMNKLYVCPFPSNGDFGASKLKWTKIEKKINRASYRYLTNIGTQFYFHTNLNAHLYRIVKFDLENPKLGFVEVVSENQNRSPLAFVQVVGDNKVVLVYSVDVQDVLFVYDLISGQQLSKFDLPAVASISEISGRPGDSEVFYTYSGFITPTTVMSLDIETGVSKLFHQALVPGFDPADYESYQVFYESKDLVPVPMFIAHRKGIQLDNSHPTYLYGYGGMSASLAPEFVVSYAAYMKHFGGVVAVPNIRGGGEYGESWHLAGSGFRKQNTFNDFQWAAKYLVSKNYTTSSKLAINGDANGGVLIAACMNQAPELFGAAVINFGLFDLLHYEFFYGFSKCKDFGNIDKEEDFQYLSTYSPLQNIKKQTYPATLISTRKRDPRVSSFHSFKYISELQHKNPQNPNPLLIHIARSRRSVSKAKVDSLAVMYSFIAMNTGAVWQD